MVVVVVVVVVVVIVAALAGISCEHPRHLQHTGAASVHALSTHPTTLARIDAGNVSAIKITRRGLRQAAE